MKAGDIRSKDEASLKADLADLKKEQFNLRFQQATGQLAKPSRSAPPSCRSAPRSSPVWTPAWPWRLRNEQDC